MFRRRPWILHAFVAEMVDILDEALHLAEGLSFSELLIARPCLAESIPCERLLEHVDQRTVSGEEDTIELVLGTKVLRRGIQADQSFPRPGHARHEADDLATSLARVANNLV